MDILCIIPFYNEKENLKKLIYDLVNNKLINKNFDFLFIDDGSNDSSSQEISNFNLIKNNKNLGYGATIKSGIKFAIKNKYKYLSVMPGDYQRDFNDLLKLKQALSEFKDYDLINGSKLHLKSIPFWNKVTNLFYSKYINLLTGSSEVSDVLSGFRIYKLDSLGDYFDILPNDYAFDSCFFLNLKKSKKNIKNIEVFANYKNQTSKMRFKLIVFMKIFIKLNIFYIKTLLKISI